MISPQYMYTNAGMESQNLQDGEKLAIPSVVSAPSMTFKVTVLHWEALFNTVTASLWRKPSTVCELILSITSPF